MSEIHLTKLEVARRQLDTAVKLFFTESDPVAVHTITSAAYDVLRGINKHAGGEPMLIKDRLLDVVERNAPEALKCVREALNQPQNFFKHADEDPTETLSFKTEYTSFFLFDACTTFVQLSGDTPRKLYVFSAWFRMKNSEFYEDEDDASTKIFRSIVSGCENMSRVEFYKHMMAESQD